MIETRKRIMFRKALVVLMVTALMLTACTGFCEALRDAADTVIIGKIYTGDDSIGVVEAVAVKDGKVVYAGDKETAEAMTGDDTEVFKTEEGQLVVPGFVDGHTHVTAMQLLNHMVVFSTNDTLDGYIRILTEFVEKNPEYPLYMGKGWINSSFENSCPTADILDELVPNTPVALMSSDGHSLWCNTAMMDIYGIDKNTPDPDGGKIERYADGTPNGCFRETAMTMVAGPLLALMAMDPDTHEANIISAQVQYAALGYTSYLEVMVNSQDAPMVTTGIDVYEQLDRENRLYLYTQGGFVINNSEDALECLDVAIDYKNSTAGGMFELTNIKIFMDGVIEGSTAYLCEPYCNREDEYYGESRWATDTDKEKLVEIIKRANEAGLSVHFHSMGDRATRDAIDCIEKAYEEIGEPVLEVRNALTHLQVIKPEDIQRMHDLNMVAVLNDWGCKHEGFYKETEVLFLGEERAEKEYPYKSFLDAGVKASFATDFGGSFIVDSILALHTFVTRTPESCNPELQLNPSECLSMDETLKLMSSGGAYQLKRENSFGKLTEGMDADLVVISSDLLEISGDQIMDAKVLKTMSDGNWIYG